MYSPSSRLLRVAVIAGVLALSAAEFELSQLDKDGGDFGFIQGSTRCPGVITFNDDDFAITAADIEVNQDQCSGGVLTLAKNPDAGGTLLTEKLREDSRRGTSIEGAIGATLTCGDVKLVPGTYFQIFSPDETLPIDLEDLLGTGAPLVGNTTGNFDFLSTNDYLILGAECMYSRRAFDAPLCFPGDAVVTLESGAQVEMSQLATGDSVLVGADTYSRVFMWTHRDAAAAPAGEYVELTTAHHKVTLTRGHYVYASPRSAGAAAPRLVPAGAVRRGDVLSTVSGGEAVASARGVAAAGLYNPQTLHGDIVVGGVVASTYTTAVPPAAAHALMAPLRWAWGALQTGARTGVEAEL